MRCATRSIRPSPRFRPASSFFPSSCSLPPSSSGAASRPDSHYGSGSPHMRDFHLPGRSPVRATDAMVATSHPLATFSALEMLRGGGNAMDAAVCAAAVQAVVEPQSTGIGGDCFVLYCPRGEGTVLAFNGSGRAPMAATADWYAARGFQKMPTYGPHSVTIPGA